MEIRPYASADRDACLVLFDSNTPEYFLPHERAHFEAWLDSNPENYFVLEHEGTITACGGYVLPSGEMRDARLTWGMVSRHLHRKGLGRFLLMYRIREIRRKAETTRTVSLETTPQSAPFFTAQGFHAVHVTKDGYAPGLDKVEMVRKISVCP